MTRPITLERAAGSTIKQTWTNSGAAPSLILSTLLDSSGSLVSSVAGVSSGNGHYFALHDLPNTRAWYLNKWYAVIDARTYINMDVYVRAVIPEVY